MPSLKDTWLTWDKAWDNGVETSKRLEFLKECGIPEFIYTNPDLKITGNLTELAEYISKTLQTLQESGNNAQVKHLQWMENNSQGALQWDMINTNKNEAFMSGWSYGKYNEEGKLICVADFW